MRYLINVFKGMLPKELYRRKPIEFAELASNCEFDTGNLVPHEGLANEPGDLKNSGNVAAIFLHNGDWLSFLTRTHLATSPIARDSYNRVYWTDGVNKPQVAYGSMLNTAGADPVASYDLGVPAPVSPITYGAINNNDQNTQDYSDDETRFYTYTYVTEAGEEGPQAPLSAELTILDPNAEVNLNIPSLASNTANITHVRVYRSVTSISSAEFMLVAEVPIASSNLLDNYSDDDLGKTLDTSNAMPPPDDLQGLTKLPNGILAGFSGNTMCFSEAYLPYSWPVANRQPTEHRIVGIAAFGGGLLITTEGHPEIAFGTTPDSMTLEKSNINEPCVSPDSIVDMGDFVIYASPNGLISASARGFKILTKELLTPEQWQAYTPQTIIGTRWKNKYVGFHSGTGGFILDLETSSLTKLDFYAQAAYHDLFNEKLYLVVDSQLQSMTGTKLDYTWSKKFELNGRVAPAALKIESLERANLTITYKVDDVSRVNGSFDALANADGIVRLPALRGEHFDITLNGTAEVERLIFGNSMSEVAS